MKLKKAAMFGLDARIALVIFGALSVISGAALYSAIQNAKVTAIITDLNERGKAYDAYYLDVGEELDLVNLNIYLESRELIQSSKTGWKGPYIADGAVDAYWMKSGYMLEELKDGDWAGTEQANWVDANCVSGTVTGDCGVWAVKALGATGKLMAEQIDIKVDGSIDGTTGRVRFFSSSGGSWYVLLKQRLSLKY